MKRPTKTELRRTIETSMEVLSAPDGAAQFPVRELEGVETAFGPVFVGCDAGQRWHLLLTVSNDAIVVADHESRGIHVGRRELVDAGTPRKFVELICVMPRLTRLFVIIGVDVLERLLATPEAPAEVVGETISEWRELVERAARKVHENQVRAVFGELYQLRELVHFDPRMVTAWRGPDNEAHDLERDGLAIEVKSKKRPGPTVAINGIDQLRVPAEGELVLVVHVIEKDETGENVGDLADAIASLGGDRSIVLDGLGKLGVDPLDPRVVALRFTVRSELAYRVESGFPRLVRDDLVEGHLHPAIRAISYTLDLSSAEDARLTPAELTAYRERLAES